MELKQKFMRAKERHRPTLTEYEDAIRYLYGLERFGVKLGLSNITELLDHLDNPHRKLRSVHIAGTNGKGSVCAFLDSVLRSAGYSTGMFTSPHLVTFRERIRVNGKNIPKKDVINLIRKVKPIAERMGKESIIKQPTFFEFSTAMAFLYFAEKKVDFAIVEVGMGGRLDATNVIHPEVSVITHLALDHTEHLGKTLDRVTREKAGIIKEGVPVVLAEESPIVREICGEKGCPLVTVGKDVSYERVEHGQEGQQIRVSDGEDAKLSIALLGGYQAQNAATAFAALGIMRKKGYSIPRKAILEGFSSAEWPARLEVMRRNPTVIVDSSHNPDGMEKTVRSLKEDFEFDRLILVIGMMSDKDLAGIAKSIGPLSDIAFCVRPNYKRALDASSIAGEMKKYSKDVRVVPDVAKALQEALSIAKRDYLICVTGSIFVAGEATRFFRDGEVT